MGSNMTAQQQIWTNLIACLRLAQHCCLQDAAHCISVTGGQDVTALSTYLPHLPSAVQAAAFLLQAVHSELRVASCDVYAAAWRLKAAGWRAPVTKWLHRHTHQTLN